MSPAHQVLHPRELAEWIIQEKLNARLQLQLQKYYGRIRHAVFKRINRLLKMPDS